MKKLCLLAAAALLVVGCLPSGSGDGGSDASVFANNGAGGNNGGNDNNGGGGNNGGGYLDAIAPDGGTIPGLPTSPGSTTVPSSSYSSTYTQAGCPAGTYCTDNGMSWYTSDGDGPCVDNPGNHCPVGFECVSTTTANASGAFPAAECALAGGIGDTYSLPNVVTDWEIREDGTYATLCRQVGQCSNGELTHFCMRLPANIPLPNGCTDDVEFWIEDESGNRKNCPDNGLCGVPPSCGAYGDLPPVCGGGTTTGGPGTCAGVCANMQSQCPGHFNSSCEADCQSTAVSSSCLGCCANATFDAAKCADEGVGEVGFEDCDDDEICPDECGGQ